LRVTTDASLIAAARKQLVLASTTADKHVRSTALRRLAEILVDLRERCLTPEGEPDWLGKTYAYRQLVGEVYSTANVPLDAINGTQSATRYHVGNVIRERLSDEDRERIGLQEAGPRDRARSAKERAADTLRSVTEARTNPLRGIEAASDFLGAVDAFALSALPAAERRQARSKLARLCKDAERLSDAATRTRE
jgi:hypothetical protein